MTLVAAILLIVAGVIIAGVAQLVEHHVANVNVVGSSPITRSILNKGENMSDDEDEKRKKFLNMVKDLAGKINDYDPIEKTKYMLKIGDKVKFIKLLSDDYRVWFLPSEHQMEKLKTRLNTVATVMWVEKSYGNGDRIDYFLDVEFSDGSYMKRINSLCFKKLFPLEEEEDPDFEWI